MRLPAVLSGLLLASIACHRTAREGAVVPPVLVSGQAAIPYPPDLFLRRIEGEVLLYLVVDSAGTVIRDSTRVAKTSGQAAFDAAALEAATRWHFTPARRDRTAVTSPIQLPVRFTIPDSIKHSGAHP
jgi:TonB family protein